MKFISRATLVLSFIAALASAFAGIFQLPHMRQEIHEQQIQIVQLRSQVNAVTMMTAAEFGGHAKFGGQGGGGGTHGGAGGGGGGGFGQAGGNGGSIYYARPKRPPVKNQ